MPEVHVIDATKELGIIRFMKDYMRPFEVIGTYRLIDDGVRPEATVMLRAGKQEMHEADMGVGPVDALANVLKKSLSRLFPDLPGVRLLDFEVHLIQGTIGTSAQVEVSVIFSDGTHAWRVSSTSDNINHASFRALLDGYEYAIYLWGKKKAQRPKTQDQRPTAKSPKNTERALKKEIHRKVEKKSGGQTKIP